jgi:hypothetical protein
MTGLAEQEVEVRMLALHSGQLGGVWAEARADCDPQEEYRDRFLDSLGCDSRGRGRKKAMCSPTGNGPRLIGLCPEIEKLRERLAEWSQSRAD